MGGKIFAVLSCCLFVQIASSEVASPNSPASVNSLPFDMFAKLFIDFHKKAASNAEAFIQPLDEAIKPLAKTLDDTIGSLNKQVGGLLTNFQSNIEKDVTKAAKPLTNEFPELSKDLGFFAKSTQNLITKLSTTGDKQVKEVGNKVLETAAEFLKVVNTKVQDAAKKTQTWSHE